MSKATFPLELHASIKAEAARLAKEDRVSLNQWIATAVAQQMGAVETAAAFFKCRAGDAQPGDLKAFQASVPDVPPERGDAIPDNLRPDSDDTEELARLVRLSHPRVTGQVRHGSAKGRFNAEAPSTLRGRNAGMVGQRGHQAPPALRFLDRRNRRAIREPRRLLWRSALQSQRPPPTLT